MTDEEIKNIISDFAHTILDEMHGIINKCYVEHTSESQIDMVHAFMEAAFVELALHNAARHDALRAGGDPVKTEEFLSGFPTSIAVNAELTLDEHLEDVLESYTTLPKDRSDA